MARRRMTELGTRRSRFGNAVRYMLCSLLKTQLGCETGHSLMTRAALAALLREEAAAVRAQSRERCQRLKADRKEVAIALIDVG